MRSGNKDVFAVRLRQEYGQNVLEDLNRKKNILKSFTHNELEEIIEKYRRLYDTP
jgi:hypothetical protein